LSGAEALGNRKALILIELAHVLQAQKVPRANPRAWGGVARRAGRDRALAGNLEHAPRRPVTALTAQTKVEPDQKQKAPRRVSPTRGPNERRWA